MKKSTRENLRKMGYSFHETEIIDALKGAIGSEVGGLENSLLDGHITEAEFTEKTSLEGKYQLALSVLKQAQRDGVLENPMNDRVIEEKHIRFLGSDRINELALQAMTLTM